MDVVIRPANDVFLRQVVFPAFELSATAPHVAVEHLLHYLDDEPTRISLELLFDQTHLTLGANNQRWNDLVYRLLFFDWLGDAEGWTCGGAFSGYAAQWEESFHVALMLEDPDYQYAVPGQADHQRRAFWARPQEDLGLAALMCGVWDPPPAFTPSAVFSAAETTAQSMSAGNHRADWAWRPMTTVNRWAARLPGALNRLLAREVKRLHPIDPPERFELIDYWLGRNPEPPVLAVSFSGLGPWAHRWLLEVGQLAHLLRDAASAQQGLTAVMTRHGPRRGVDLPAE